MIFIVIPVYNTGRYLTECLDSVFAQTYRDLYVVCADDGSTDESNTVLSAYEKTHSNMVVFRTKNCGLSHARNIGIDYVAQNAKSGDFVFFLDSDDYLDSHYLGRLFSTAAEAHYDIVCSSFTYAGSSGSHRFAGMDGIFGYYSAYEATKLLIEDKTIQSHAHCKLYRAELFKQLRYPNELRFMEDQATTFKAFAESSSIALVEEYGYFYRQRGGSLCSGVISNSKVMDAVEAYIEPFQYNFANFSDAQKRTVLEMAKQSLAACYLMMCPRFSNKSATQEERRRWKKLSNFVFSRKIINGYTPNSDKEKWKRRCFLYVRPIYRVLYRTLMK